MADPFARLTIPELLKLPPPKSVVPLAKNVPLFRKPEFRALDKPVKLVAPFALNVPEFAKLNKPLMLVVPLAANAPAFAKVDAPLNVNAVVPLVVNVPPAWLLNATFVNPTEPVAEKSPPD